MESDVNKDAIIAELKAMLHAQIEFRQEKEAELTAAWAEIEALKAKIRVFPPRICAEAGNKHCLNPEFTPTHTRQIHCSRQCAARRAERRRYKMQHGDKADATP